MTTGRSLAINTLILSATDLLAKVTSLALVMVVGRKLGPELMGVYSYGLTFTGFFAIFVEYGLETYIQREVGRHPETSGRLMADVLYLQILLFAASAAAIFIATPWAAEAGLKRQVIWILTGVIFFRSQLGAVGAFFRAHERTAYEAAVRATLRLVYSLAGLAAILGGQGLVVLVSLELLAQALACAVGWALYVARIGRPFFPPLRARLTALARQTKYFLLLRLVGAVFNSLDVIMISLLVGDVATGYYAAAGRLPEAFDFLPGAFTGAFLPVISRQVAEDRAAFKTTFRSYFKYLLILGLGVAAVLAGQSGNLIGLLFGPRFDPAAGTQMILALTMVGTFASWSLSNLLIALDRERRMFAVFLVGSGLNVGLNFILIPALAQDGAAWATVAARVLVIALQLACLGRGWLGELRLGALSLRPLAAGLLAFGLGLGLERLGLGWLAGLILTGVGFLISLFLTGALTRAEVKAGAAMFRERRG